MTLAEKIELILTTDLSDIRNWFQFYPADWLTSLRLRATAPGARGLLVDLMAYTWDTGNPGVITLDDFFLFAQNYNFEEVDVHLWLKQLSQSVQSPVQVLDISGLMLVIIPRLVDIAVKQIAKRKSCKERGSMGGRAGGSKEGQRRIKGGSKEGQIIDPPYVAAYLESGLNRVEVTELDPQLPIEGLQHSSSDKNRIEENRREESSSKPTSGQPKRKLTAYSESFLKWYLGEGVEGYRGYPNKSGKMKAFGYWKDMQLDARVEEIIENTARQIKERRCVMRADPGSFLPTWQAAKTYINNESWEDSYLTEALAEKRFKAEERKKGQSIFAFFPAKGTLRGFPNLTALHEYAESNGYLISLLDGEYRLTKKGK